MNKQEAIAALGGPESARRIIAKADPGEGPWPFLCYQHEHAIVSLALYALDAPSDGWAALENARAWAVTQRDQCKDEEQRNKNTSDPYWRGCALAFEQAIGAIDRELDARPAKASARARAEKAEKERGHLAAIVRGDGGHGTFEEALEQASWFRADKGELLARAEKAEAEVARLQAIVAAVKEAAK